jgi:hypothetical protein
MRYLRHLPVWRDANALLLAIEQAVRQFPRYHKYTLGTDLRRQAMGICRLIVRAYNDKPRQAEQVRRLVLAVDDLKVLIQLGKELQAFRRFDEFETIARLAVDVGRQCGGWHRQSAARRAPAGDRLAGAGSPAL